MKIKYNIELKLQHPEDDFFTIAKAYCESNQESTDIQTTAWDKATAYRYKISKRSPSEFFLSCLAI